VRHRNSEKLLHIAVVTEYRQLCHPVLSVHRGRGSDLPLGARRTQLSIQPGKPPAVHKDSRRWEGIADIVSLLRDDQRPSMAKVIFALIL
jgi:hypothetical protein